MRRLAAMIVWAFVICGVGGLLFAGCSAYFVRSVEIDGGAVFDGLGRELKRAPFVARMVFGADTWYAGAGWFVVDGVVFWVTVALLYSL